MNGQVVRDRRWEKDLPEWLANYSARGLPKNGTRSGVSRPNGIAGRMRS